MEFPNLGAPRPGSEQRLNQATEAIADLTARLEAMAEQVAEMQKTIAQLTAKKAAPTKNG
jgi:chromosome segregation ATPase